ncbi:MAG: hypothetical protein Q8P38_02730 [Candidatus Nanopelagicales bacterium]|nr:hypothetical protein [Candidatus Nanopelagicales bacterium]
MGVTLLGLVTAGRFTSGEARVLSAPGAPIPAEPLADVFLGILDLALEMVQRLSQGARSLAGPPVRVAQDPVASALAGPVGAAVRVVGVVTRPLAERGARLRAEAEHEAAEALSAALPETVGAVLAEIDLTGFVVDHLDLARVVDASLDEVDLTELALRRLDLGRVVDATLDEVDALSLARDRLDPVRVAAYLRDNVDLGEALRSAPGAMAGEAVRGVRETMGKILTSGRT